MGVADLSSVLWREREMLELLLFKLEEEQLILASGRSRWLAHATHEVEVILERIRQTEILRAAEVAAVGVDCGAGPDVSLAELVDLLDEPWSELFGQHRAAFLELTAQVGDLAEANRGLLTAGERAIRETMLVVTGSTETYGRRGKTVAGVPRTRLIDEAM